MILPPHTPAEMGDLIRNYLWRRSTPPQAEVNIRQLLAAFPDYRSTDLLRGVDRGVMEGWWVSGSNGCLVFTPKGAERPERRTGRHASPDLDRNATPEPDSMAALRGPPTTTV